MKHFVIACFLFAVLTGCNTAPPETLDQFVHCRSLDGERTAIKILEWKFEAVRSKLSVICEMGVAIPAQEIMRRTLKTITPELRESLGEAEECVELTLKELEVRGVFERSEPSVTDKAKLELTRVAP